MILVSRDIFIDFESSLAAQILNNTKVAEDMILEFTRELSPLVMSKEIEHNDISSEEGHIGMLLTMYHALSGTKHCVHSVVKIINEDKTETLKINYTPPKTEK